MHGGPTLYQVLCWEKSPTSHHHVYCSLFYSRGKKDGRFYMQGVELLFHFIGEEMEDPKCRQELVKSRIKSRVVCH